MHSLSRRKFLGLSAALGAVGISLDQLPKKPFALKQHIDDGLSYVLADFHTHPHKRFRGDAIDDAVSDEILGALSQGIIGLAYRNENPYILDFDSVMSYCRKNKKWAAAITPVDSTVAKVEHNGSQGWIVRCQEISSKLHILGIGIDQYLPDVNDPVAAAELIHNAGGFAVLNHPYIVISDGSVRTLRDEELSLVVDVLDRVDEVETFNAACIPYFGTPDGTILSWTNSFAHRIIQGTSFKGMASSDTHKIYDSLLCAGNYVPVWTDEGLNRSTLFDSLRTKRFTTIGRYQTPSEFYQGSLEPELRRIWS